MEKIIVFTDYDSLIQVNRDLAQQSCIPLIGENNFTVFNKQRCEFQISVSIKDGEVFFAKDEVNSTILDQFIGAFDKKKIGVLKHRKPDLSSQIDFAEFAKTEDNGQHESWGKFYPTVLKIITNSDPDKFARLQRAIWWADNAEQDKKEALKELLHKIYRSEIPDTIPDTLKNFQKALDKFKSAVNLLPLKEQKLTNNNFGCLVKQLKRDLGI